LTEEASLPSCSREQREKEGARRYTVNTGGSSSRFHKGMVDDTQELDRKGVAVAKTPANQKSLSKCVFCNKMFPTSVIDIHIDQCEFHSSDEEESLLPKINVGQKSISNSHDPGKRSVEQPQSIHGELEDFDSQEEHGVLCVLTLALIRLSQLPSIHYLICYFVMFLFVSMKLL